MLKNKNSDNPKILPLLISNNLTEIHMVVYILYYINIAYKSDFTFEIKNMIFYATMLFHH